jgi:hypothetical protein
LDKILYENDLLLRQKGQNLVRNFVFELVFGFNRTVVILWGKNSIEISVVIRRHAAPSWVN